MIYSDVYWVGHEVWRLYNSSICFTNHWGPTRSCAFLPPKKACGRQSHWQRALWLAAELLESKVAGDLILQNSLIAACQKAGQWHRALQLLAELPSKALQPTVVSYNAAISACARVWQIAMMLAHRTDVQRDVITFNAAMSSLDQDALQWQRAFHLFLSLKWNELVPSVVTGSTAMSVVGHRWKVALQFLEADGDLRADVVMYSAGINACGKCQERQRSAQRDSPHYILYQISSTHQHPYSGGLGASDFDSWSRLKHRRGVSGC